MFQIGRPGSKWVHITSDEERAISVVTGKVVESVAAETAGVDLGRSGQSAMFPA